MIVHSELNGNNSGHWLLGAKKEMKKRISEFLFFPSIVSDICDKWTWNSDCSGKISLAAACLPACLEVNLILFCRHIFRSINKQSVSRQREKRRNPVSSSFSFDTKMYWLNEREKKMFGIGKKLTLTLIIVLLPFPCSGGGWRTDR